MLHRAVFRPLRECSLTICMEDTKPFRSNDQAGRGSKLCRMDSTVAHSEPFGGHEQREDKKLLLDLMAVNLEKEVKRPGFAIIAAVKRK